MKNLVMGLVKGYTFEQLRPFVASLRETGYTGDVCLFYSDLDDDTIKSLREYGAELVPFKLSQINLGVKRVQPCSVLNRLYESPLRHLYPVNRTYAGLVNLLSSRDYVTKSRIAAKFLNVYCVRFPLYYIHLARWRGEYANVMITDVRDVIFQRDPFDFDLGDEVCCFLEDDRTHIRDCPFNSLWIEKGFGGGDLEEIGGQIISCSGVNIGSYDAVMRYLEAMIDHLLLLKFHGHGIDQGVHNYVLYKRRLGGVRVFQNRLGPVLTMGRTVDLPYKFSEEGLILNEDGSVANVLHQYDRHVELGKLSLDESDGGVKLRLP